MKKLLIVDSSNLLFQMFFGMPSRIVSKDGKAIHATLGFVGALIKIIKMSKPSHIIIVFDGEHENERSEILPEYKANRTDYSAVPQEENPFSQIEDVYKAINYMGIQSIETTEHEADDVIAAYVLTLGSEVKVVVSSYDSDFFQLINDNVCVLRYRGSNSIICDREYVKAKFGIEPEKYAEFKSLTGDKSDNIRGVENVGAKTAADLINRFGSLNILVNNIESIAKPSVRTAVMRSKERLIDNYKLIKLDNKAMIPLHISKLEYNYNGITTNEVLNGIGLR